MARHLLRRERKSERYSQSSFGCGIRISIDEDDEGRKCIDRGGQQMIRIIMRVGKEGKVGYAIMGSVQMSCSRLC